MLFKSTVLSLLSLASAMPLAEYAKMLSNIDARALGVTEADLSNMRFYVEWAGASYCNSENSPGEDIVCSADACPTVESNDAETVGTFFGDDTGIASVVGLDHTAGAIVFSVRGSSNVRNWITNIAFAWQDCDLTSQCKLHTGFANAWREMSSGVLTAVRAAREQHPDYAVIATGHSLGGAVAAIGASYLRDAGIPVDVYSFGAPRAGNDHYVRFVNAQTNGQDFRITHGADPVSRLPPIVFGYRHTSPEYWLNGHPSDYQDYGVGDIKVCEGIASVSCNSGTFGLDVDAHNNMFRDISACNPKGKRLVKDQQEESDEELEQRLDRWVEEDLEWVHEHSEE